MSLRIIGGEFKGRKLRTNRGALTRPTSDRLRESIFNILSRTVHHTVVLDLFAGTGALGIEALSRGAESAVFIDMNTEATSTIERNIHTCGLSSRSAIIQWNIITNLDCLRSAGPVFNLVFIDPPYNTNSVKQTLLNLHESRSLAEGAQVVVEHSDAEPIPDDLSGFEINDQRKYGKTIVSFLHCVV